MKAYSLDLRERVLAARQAGATEPAVAAQFRVSVSFVAKLVHRQRTEGTVAARAGGRGPAPHLKPAGRSQLADCLRQTPDATLDELRTWLVALGPEPLGGGPGRTGAGLATQKKSVHAAERDTERVRALRAAFLEAVQQEDFTCFKFVDETSPNLTYYRRYARAEGGQRARQGVPLHGGPNVTLVAALPPTGLQAAMPLSGAVNGAVFAAYLDQVLGPTLVPGDVVVLDNLSAHQVAGLAELVAARGARLLYLPPYSPDFNPIELAFSKLKTWLRTAQARTREALEATISAATEWISQQDAKNWFDHCGYHVQ